MTERDVAIEVLDIKKITPYGSVLYDRVLTLVERYYPAAHRVNLTPERQQRVRSFVNGAIEYHETYL